MWQQACPAVHYNLIGILYTVSVSGDLKVSLNKKASDFLLSRDEPNIIDVRELDFRVRNGNGYYLSTMVTGI